MRTMKLNAVLVLAVLAVFMVGSAVAAPLVTVWSDTTVATTAKVTSTTVVQPASASADVTALVSLSKGTATNVIVTPVISDGAVSPTYYPLTASAVTMTASGSVIFDDALWEPGRPAVLSVVGTGDVTTTPPVLTIKLRLR